jgi:hypothetical protein
MRADPLVHFGPFYDSAHYSGGAVAVESVPVCTNEVFDREPQVGRHQQGADFVASKPTASSHIPS